MRESGFTLIELVVVIAVMGIIATMGYGVYKQAQTKNQLAVAVNVIVSDLRRAQILAQASDGDSPWGVSVTSGQAIIFKGTSFISRETAKDEALSLPAGVTVTGLSETVFAKFSGIPGATGSFTVTASPTQTQIISISSKGVVSF